MDELSDAARRTLIAIARDSVAAAVEGRKAPPLPAGAREGELTQPGGCFVTLKTHGELRGCLGHFEADAPIAERVNEMAAASATEDPRFLGNRLGVQDLPALEIEISVLSPREQVDDPLSIEVGRDGIYIRKGYRSGCYLPQVATELGWDKEQFLASCCSHKAGLSPDAWKDADTTVMTFTAQVFGALGDEHP